MIPIAVFTRIDAGTASSSAFQQKPKIVHDHAGIGVHVRLESAFTMRWKPRSPSAGICSFVSRGKLQIVHTVADVEAGRLERITISLRKKMPKLQAWKRDAGARTVLVLEENDIQLTNCHVVTSAVLEAERTLGRAADEIYLVTTSFAPWQVHYLRVDDRTYFDLSDPDERSWGVDPTQLVALTDR